MVTYYRLIEPSSSDAQHSHTHYEDPGGRKSLCGQARIFKSVDGERMRVWYRTKRPVTCKTCIARMLRIVRMSMAVLTGEQLEDIAQHVDTFVNKYPAPAPIGASDGTK